MKAHGSGTARSLLALVSVFASVVTPPALKASPPPAGRIAATTSHTTLSAAAPAPALEALSRYQSDLAIALCVPQIVWAGRQNLNEPANRIRLARYYVLVARAFMFDTNISSAEQALRIARQLDPSNKLATAYLAESLAMQAQFAESDALYQQIESSPSKDAIATKALAVRALRRFDIQQALHLFQSASDLDPQDNSTRIDIANCLRSIGFTKQAAQAYRAAAKAESSDFNREYFLGLADNISGKTTSALEHYRNAGKVLPAEPLWHTKVGLLLSGMNRKEKALDEFGKAVLCSRLCVQSVTYYADYLSYLGKRKSGLNCLDKLEQLVPFSAAPHIVKADMYRRMNLPEKAELEFLAAIQLNPRNAWAYDNLASLYQNRKRYDRMIETLKKSTDNTPKFARTWGRLGDGYVNLKQFDQAISFYARCLSMAPQPIEALSKATRAAIADRHAGLGRCYYMTGKTSEAFLEATSFNSLKHIQKPVKYLSWVKLRPGRLTFEHPDSNEPFDRALRHVALADMLFQVGSLTECCLEYRAALELQPNNTEWHMFLFSALMESGNYGEAIKEDFILSNKIVGALPKAFSTPPSTAEKTPSKQPPEGTIPVKPSNSLSK